MSQNSNPTTFVIFGITGDLSKKKLIPAVFELFRRGLLSEEASVVGFARSKLGDEEYKEYLRGIIKEKADSPTEDEIEHFLARTWYAQGTFEEPEKFGALAEELVRRDEERGVCSNKLFYLAVPPNFYHVLLQNLADSGLTVPCSQDEGWTRVLVEKPFGRDAETAEELDRFLGLLFKEEQIFRIDHYLAKETVQNLLLFRFANSIFEPVWNRDYIEKIEIKLHEKFGVEDRGSFYDAIGTLRDVGQNHIMQMLALVTMDEPATRADADIRARRTDIIKSLCCVPELKKGFVRGQYKEYRGIEGVQANSETETFFRIQAHIENDRWRGVPIMLESGKALDETKTEIEVYFKEPASGFCPPGAPEPFANKLVFRIQPNEGISIRFWTKKPGLQNELEPRNLHFYYKETEEAQSLTEAYIKILYDAVVGDQTLFTATEEVVAAWRFIHEVLDIWHDLPLVEYKKGTPAENINST